MASIKPSDGKYDEVRKRVKEWILAEGSTFSPTKLSHLVWCLEVTQGDGMAYAVFQNKGKPDVLGMDIHIRLDEFQQGIKSLSKTERSELLFDLRFALLNFDVAFQVPDEMEQIDISKHLYVEDLTRTNFWKSVLQVQKGLLAVVWTLQSKFPNLDAQATTVFDESESIN